MKKQESAREKQETTCALQFLSFLAVFNIFFYRLPFLCGTHD